MRSLSKKSVLQVFATPDLDSAYQLINHQQHEPPTDRTIMEETKVVQIETDETDSKVSQQKDAPTKNLNSNAQETFKKDTPDLRYKMDSSPRGLAMIINNAAFPNTSGFNPRQGSEVDVRKLSELFEYLGFAVGVQENLSKKQIHAVIQKFKEKFEEIEVDMCIFCIMTHGSNGNLVDINGEEIDAEDDIIKEFYNTEALRGKPKLFLLQYCRGGEMDYGVEETRGLSDTRQQRVEDKFIFTPKLPSVADILIANSTVPGFVSHRNLKHGTWFIQCFTKVFQENAVDTDIREMFDKVSNTLSNMESKNEDRTKQTFDLISRGFFKKLYFNPTDISKKL